MANKTLDEITNILNGAKSVILKNSENNYIAPMTTVKNVLGLEDELSDIAGELVKISDGVHIMTYKGTLDGKNNLIDDISNPKQGDLYIASEDFTFTNRGTFTEVESGDIIIRGDEGWDVVQGNISTTSLVHNGEADVESKYSNRIMLANRDSKGVVTMSSIEAPANPEGKVLMLTNNIGGAPIWSNIDFPVKGVKSGSALSLDKNGDDKGKLSVNYDNNTLKVVSGKLYAYLTYEEITITEPSSE